MIRVTIGACGVCRTDLHVVDGDLPKPMLPIIPGHEIVGRIESIGAGVDISGSTGLHMGQRISVANLTRQDGLDFLRLAPEMGIVTSVTRYKLEHANEALADLRAGPVRQCCSPGSLRRGQAGRTA